MPGHTLGMYISEASHLAGGMCVPPRRSESGMAWFSAEYRELCYFNIQAQSKGAALVKRLIRLA